MGKLKVLRAVSRISAALLAMHVAMLAMYFSVGMVMGILDPQFFEFLGQIIAASAIVTLAIFCISTQIYLGEVKKDRD